jgi:DNA polymerase-3 subunit gamma/tau
VAASLYRRHRPRTFADVVGQEHVVRTLSNAIAQGRVHHAYLFVGSRGTGKTSMAKILAASLNCQGEAGGGMGPGGPTVTPCGACESCRAIATATSLDVIEMDAASNNSVDDIRDLRERVAYAPVAGAYKVYILDEAHMLTPAAWNAFLKTLEEPPPHTIFVLATTEANKVLPTVVDRCHRFDFGRPSVSQIATVLCRAAESESIEIPDEAIALVARSATGSFRDALGTLEQLLAYSGRTIVLDDVLAVLGAADADLLFGTLDAVSAGDAKAALLAAARLAESGRDLGRFFGDLEAHARGLLVTQVLGEVPAELSVTPEQDERLADQARRVGGAEIVRLLELIAFALRAMKDGADPRTQLELALVKAAKPDLEPSVKALHERIARLENRPAAAAPPAATRTPTRAETAAGRAAAAAPAGAPASDGGAAPAGAPASGAAAPPASPLGDQAAEHGRTAVAITAQVEGQPPVAASTTLPGAGHASAGEAQEVADDAAAAVAQKLATEADPTPAVAAVAVVEPEAPTPEPTFSAGVELSLEAFGSVWPAVVDSLREETPMLAALLEDCAPAALADDGLTLAWPESSAFLKRKAEDPANRELIAKAIREVTGSSLRLAYELRADGEALSTAAPAAPQLSEDDLVKRFMDEFDAEELPPDPEEQT